MLKVKERNFGRPKIPLPSNFKEEYEKWKAGKQSAKSAMSALKLKRGKFYMFVKEYENRG